MTHRSVSTERSDKAKDRQQALPGVPDEARTEWRGFGLEEPIADERPEERAQAKRRRTCRQHPKPAAMPAPRHVVEGGALALTILLLIGGAVRTRRPGHEPSNQDRDAADQDRCALAISPDAQVVRRRVPGPPQLYALIGVTITTLGTGAHHQFWSPDGRHIGFFADGKLKRIGVDRRIGTDAR